MGRYIGPYVKPGGVFHYVRLTDLKKACGGRWPGADIDAVGAIGAGPANLTQQRCTVRLR
jgi:hypothetical protein